MRIYIFTVHKAASVGLQQFLAMLARWNDLPHYYASSETHQIPDAKRNFDPDLLQAITDKSGIIGPIRRPVILPEEVLTDSKIVLHLRDPRDGLVSMFYSYSYSHTGIPEETRQHWINMGVDRFVLQQADDYRERYKIYLDAYMGRPETVLLQYSDFVLDRKKWARQLLAHTGLRADEVELQEWEADTLATKDIGENKHRHIRKALPGDYKEKLAPETITRLNEIFGDILDPFGYA